MSCFFLFQDRKPLVKQHNTGKKSIFPHSKYPHLEKPHDHVQQQHHLSSSTRHNGRGREWTCNKLTERVRYIINHNRQHWMRFFSRILMSLLGCCRTVIRLAAFNFNIRLCSPGSSSCSSEKNVHVYIYNLHILILCVYIYIYMIYAYKRQHSTLRVVIPFGRTLHFTAHFLPWNAMTHQHRQRQSLDV